VTRPFRPAIAAALVAVMLSGCAPAKEEEPAMDLAAVQRELDGIGGVVESSTGARNTGVPGGYALRVQLVVDDDGLASIGEVLQEAVDDVAGAASAAEGYREYEFTVSVTDPSSPTGTRRVTLSRHQERIAIDQGALTSSLILTADELAAAAAR